MLRDIKGNETFLGVAMETKSSDLWIKINMIFFSVTETSKMERHLEGRTISLKVSTVRTSPVLFISLFLSLNFLLHFELSGLLFCS